MNTATIIAVIQLLASVVGAFVTNQQVQNILTVLEAWMPTIIAEIPEIYDDVKTIITIIKGNKRLTPEQIKFLDDSITQIDAAFDAALAAAQPGGSNA